MTQISNVSQPVSQSVTPCKGWLCGRELVDEVSDASLMSLKNLELYSALLCSTHLSAQPNSMVRFHAGKSIQVLHTNGRRKILKSAPASVKQRHVLELEFIAIDEVGDVNRFDILFLTLNINGVWHITGNGNAHNGTFKFNTSWFYTAIMVK